MLEVIPRSHFLRVLATTDVPSVSEAVPVLHISRNWNQTVCGLSSLPQHSGFKVLGEGLALCGGCDV